MANATIRRSAHTSLQAAIDASVDGDTIYVDGRFIETVLATVPSTKVLRFVGDGGYASRLLWTAGSGGLKIHVPSYDKQPRLEGIRFSTSQAGVGFGLETVPPSITDSPFTGPILDSLEFHGEGTNARWSYCVVLREAWNAKVRGLVMGGVGGSQVGRGLFFGGNSVNAMVRGILGSDLEFGVETDLSGNSEGLSVLGGKLVNVGVGFQLLQNSLVAGLEIIGVHIDAGQFGIRMDRRPQSYIAGNLLYRNGSAAWVGIEVVRSNDTRVIGNHVIRPTAPDGTENAVVVTASSRVIMALGLSTLMDTAYWLKTDSDNCHVIGNRGDSNGTHVLDQGTNNYKIDNTP